MFDHARDNQTVGAMREVGPYGRRNDNRDRSTEAKLHPHVFRHAERAKALEKYRYNDRTAADAEQPGEQPTDHAANQNQKNEPKDFVEANPVEHVE